MDVASLASKYIHDHNNPLVKNETTGLKCLLGDEQPSKTQCFEAVESKLKHSRVDRRCARSQAEWLPKENLARLKKTVKQILTNYGFQNKTGRFLKWNETLLLLETNKLELIYNNGSLSLQEAFKMILNQTDRTLNQYLVYKKLTIQGYRLTSAPDFPEVSQPKKRKIEDLDQNPSEVFERLQQIGPRTYTGSALAAAQYLVTYPQSQDPSDSFNLSVITNDCDNFKSVVDNNDHIFALCSNDNIGFYRFSQINVPFNS